MDSTSGVSCGDAAMGVTAKPPPLPSAVQQGSGIQGHHHGAAARRERLSHSESQLDFESEPSSPEGGDMKTKSRTKRQR